MERERDTDEERTERETADSIERAQAVYGETDTDPNRQDQRSAHHAEPDEHL